MNTTIINCWGGPGCGKSTTASDLFAEMKWRGHSVELINEFAKEVVWEGHHNLIPDQLWLSAHQHRKIARLIGQVEYIITDSPLMLCAIYTPEAYPKTFVPFLKDLNDEYDNFNVYLIRQKEYVPVGRSQTADEAREIDSRLWKMFAEQNIRMDVETAGNREAKYEILKALHDRTN